MAEKKAETVTRPGVSKLRKKIQAVIDEESKDRKSKRRSFRGWMKVKVR